MLLPDLPLTPADSARAVTQVYTVSMLATVPLIVAGVASLALRRAPAGMRSLVWRSAVLALLIVYFGRLLPAQWVAWVVPASLAPPLVVLGRLQLAMLDYVVPLYPTDTAHDGRFALLALTLLIAYWIVAIAILMPLVRGWLAARAVARRARPPRDPAWAALLDDARSSIGVRRRVRLLVSSESVVPMTWGFVRPVILLPRASSRWSETQRRSVLLHELAHVRAGDALFRVAGRIVCALYWFHPGAWWVARGLRAECELASDDRVLACGIRPSEYARLLVAAADTLRPRAAVPGISMALARGGLRERLAAIVDPRRDIRAPSRTCVMLATALTLAIAGPIGTVRIAPTRDVLTTLMRDSRWESRAYAVVGLAQRRDSVEVARAAATADPSPRVRAWAVYALAQHPTTPLPLPARR